MFADTIHLKRKSIGTQKRRLAAIVRQKGIYHVAADVLDLKFLRKSQLESSRHAKLDTKRSTIIILIIIRLPLFSYPSTQI